MQNSSMTLSNYIPTRVKILVVDDHPHTAALLARSLSQLGDQVDVVSATSGKQALEHAQQRAIDVLITDMNMPGMTGLELIENFQKRPGGGPAFSFLITACHTPGIEIEACRLRVREILYKPIQPEKIRNLVRQALQEMDQSESRLDLAAQEQAAKLCAGVLEDVASPILMFDTDDRLLLANPEGQKLFADYEKQLGQRLPVAAGYDSLLKHLDETRFSGVSFSGEISWLGHRVFSASLTPVKDVGCAVILHDVTRFINLARAKDEYIATASHELIKAVTAINGFSELIKKAGPTQEAQNDFIQIIQNVTAGIHELVENLLTLMKFDLGVQKEFEELNISQLLCQLVDEFQPRAKAKQQSLVIEKAEPDLKVCGDALLLDQAFRILIGNVVKGMPDGNTIALSIYKTDNLAHITINTVAIMLKETGYGIPSADLPHIFDRFYHDHDDGKDGNEGTGLELAVVKFIAEKHGGDVIVESETGKGSCFTISFPLRQEHPKFNPPSKGV